MLENSEIHESSSFQANWSKSCILGGPKTVYMQQCGNFDRSSSNVRFPDGVANDVGGRISFWVSAGGKPCVCGGHIEQVLSRRSTAGRHRLARAAVRSPVRSAVIWSCPLLFADEARVYIFFRSMRMLRAESQLVADLRLVECINHW